jgi:hypothetical protein
VIVALKKGVDWRTFYDAYMGLDPVSERPTSNYNNALKRTAKVYAVGIWKNISKTKINERNRHRKSHQNNKDH